MFIKTAAVKAERVGAVSIQRSLVKLTKGGKETESLVCSANLSCWLNSFGNVIILPQKIPFTAPIDGGLKEDMTITIKGSVLSGANRYSTYGK